MLRFNVVWDEKISKSSAEDATWGKCQLIFNQTVIWNQLRGCWVDFLEHLTSSWDDIITEPLVKDTASEIDKYSFEVSHDLSKAVKGFIVPTVLIYRKGNDFEIGFGEQKHKLGYNDTVRALTFIGNTIKDRISKIKDGRAKIAIEKWDKRNKYYGNN